MTFHSTVKALSDEEQSCCPRTAGCMSGTCREGRNGRREGEIDGIESLAPPVGPLSAGVPLPEHQVQDSSSCNRAKMNLPRQTERERTLGEKDTHTCMYRK